MKTLIKNGRIVTAVDDYHGDILNEKLIFKIDKYRKELSIS